jgi:hypothetical protein
MTLVLWPPSSCCLQKGNNKLLDEISAENITMLKRMTAVNWKERYSRIMFIQTILAVEECRTCPQSLATSSSCTPYFIYLISFTIYYEKWEDDPVYVGSQYPSLTLLAPQSWQAWHSLILFHLLHMLLSL